MKLLKPAATATLLGIAALVTSPIPEASAKPDQFTVYGGPINTSWYIMAGWLATELQRAGVKANSELGGAATNLIRIAKSPANMGFTFAAITDLGRAGEKPFPGPVSSFCGLQVLQHSAFQAMVTDASGIKEAEDLKGKTYSTQAVGNMARLAFEHFLKAYGMDESELKLAIGGQQFGADGVKDRRFAGFAAMTAVKSPPMMDAARSVDIDFLPVDDEAFEKIKSYNSGYVRTELPAGSYPGQEKAVPTFGTVTILIMNSDTSEDDQYFVTKLVHKNWDGLKATHSSTTFLTPENAVEIPGTELCPGAKRYWKEVGAID